MNGPFCRVILLLFVKILKKNKQTKLQNPKKDIFKDTQKLKKKKECIIHLPRNHHLISTIITFAAWLIWHLSYFYIEGTLPAIQIIPFSIGLLVNSFILSALYNRTESLWICVMTHSLINVFSQIGVEGNVKVYFSYIIKVIIIVLAVFISKKSKDEEKRKIQ